MKKAWKKKCGSAGPAPHHKQNIGPQRLVCGLDREDMIRRAHRIVKLPLLDRIERMFKTCMRDLSPVFRPDGGFAHLRVRIIRWNSHCMYRVQRNCCKKRPEDLNAVHYSWRKRETHNLRVWSAFARSWIVSIRDQNFRVMSCARDDLGDFWVE